MRRKHVVPDDRQNEQQPSVDPQPAAGEEGTAAPEATVSAPEAEAAAAPPAEPAEERIARLEAELEAMKDRYLRALAELENVRRRARLEAEEARRFANERLLSELLPVVDNLARALESAEQTPNSEGLKSGVELIYRQLCDVLARAGLQRIEAVGQPFDPNVHEAIMQVEPKEGEAPHQVVEELRPGYKLHDRVVRPALVKVTSG